MPASAFADHHVLMGVFAGNSRNPPLKGDTR